ncbi:MAG: hypothetical protein ACQESR_24840 [Planctomycetota bacterium]
MALYNYYAYGCSRTRKGLLPESWRHFDRVGGLFSAALRGGGKNIEGAGWPEGGGVSPLWGLAAGDARLWV